MNLRDDIELTMLAETGDADIAEASGLAVQTAVEQLCWCIGIDPALIMESFAVE